MPASVSASPFLELDGIFKAFQLPDGELKVLEDITLSVGEREFLSFVGHSGCGKSTLLRIVAGLETASLGDVRIEGRTRAEWASKRPMGFVFQSPALLPWKTLMENVRLPLDILGDGASSERQKKAEEVIELVRLSGFERQFPGQLSGGMKQRTSIARSLVYRPELLLMDEPFGALDDFTRRELTDELLRIWDETACTVLFVTHSLPEAVLLSDRVVVLDTKPGRIREIVPIDLPRPRGRDMRQTDAFLAHLRRLEALIFAGEDHG